MMTSGSQYIVGVEASPPFDQPAAPIATLALDTHRRMPPQAPALPRIDPFATVAVRRARAALISLVGQRQAPLLVPQTTQTTGDRPMRLSQCRVLCVVRPAAGGMRQHVIHLARFGAMAGPKFSIAAPAQFLNSLPDDVPVFERIPLDIRDGDFMADIRAAQALRKIAPNYNVVHAQGLRAGAIASMALFGLSVPLVITAHNLLSPRFSERIIANIISRRASRVIAVSNAVADGFARSGAPRQRLTVVPNGIDLPHFRGYGAYDRPMILDMPRRGSAPIRGSRASARMQGRFKYQLPQNEIIIGYLGRLSKEKGVDVLLAAAANLDQYLFVIAGDGPERTALEAAAPPNVRFLGRVDGTAGLLAAVDILAIPSRSEGQGIVALEAMASGVPIVASEVGGLKEMLRDGDTALLVRPGDPRALSGAITLCLEDAGMRDRMIARAGAEVEEQYDVRRMIVRIIGVYQQAMRTWRARA